MLTIFLAALNMLTIVLRLASWWPMVNWPS